MQLVYLFLLTTRGFSVILKKNSKEEDKVKEVNVVLRDIVSVRDFVQQVILTDFEVDLVQGRYIVDAKSIMGIFALDILSPIKLIAHTENEGDFFERIAKYIVK